jgi:hypothetical protein
VAEGQAQNLLVHVERSALRDSLRRFLRQRDCLTEREGEVGVLVADCGGSSPQLATLVALVDEWRSAAPAGEARLEVDGHVTILRTET